MVGAERVSFAGSLAAARRYSEALMQARSEARRRQLHEELLRVLADDLVPDRSVKSNGTRTTSPLRKAVIDLVFVGVPVACERRCRQT